MTLLVCTSELRTFASIVPNPNRKSPCVLSLHGPVRYILKATMLIDASADFRTDGGAE